MIWEQISTETSKKQQKSMIWESPRGGPYPWGGGLESWAWNPDPTHGGGPGVLSPGAYIYIYIYIYRQDARVLCSCTKIMLSMGSLAADPPWPGGKHGDPSGQAEEEVECKENLIIAEVLAPHKRKTL